MTIRRRARPAATECVDLRPMRSRLPRVAALLGLSIACAAAGSAQTTAPPPATPRTSDEFLGTATYRLWDGDAPGAQGPTTRTCRRSRSSGCMPNTGRGTAIVIAPGGAYRGLAANLEGRQVADWFAARGVTAFVLKYRLGNRYLYPTPLVDARRAMRFVRAHAAEFDIAPDRIGMMGFSAGGHLTAMARRCRKPAAPMPPTRSIASAAGPTSRCSAIPG